MKKEKIDSKGEICCSKCGVYKTIENFYKHSRICTECRNNKRREKYAENPQMYKDHRRKYYINNKEKVIEREKNYRKNNPDKVKETQKNYNLRNPGRKKKRRDNDLDFRLRENLRTRVHHAIRGITKKSDKTMNLIGCEIEFLKTHLEGLFQEGMCWDNYGKWHIDHKKPCSLFDLTIESEQKECFNYTNLQPLWAKDNLRKNNKYE